MRGFELSVGFDEAGLFDAGFAKTDPPLPGPYGLLNNPEEGAEVGLVASGFFGYPKIPPPAGAEGFGY